MPFSLVETTIVPEILKPQKPGHQLTVIRIRPRRSVVHENTRPRTGGHVLSYDLAIDSPQNLIGLWWREIARLLAAFQVKIRATISVVATLASWLTVLQTQFASTVVR
jgi:hypothetical protein